MGNRSLDEFAGDDAGTDDADTGAADPGEEADGGTGAEPAVATYEWAPAGADCAACGAVVERRWHQDGAFVCADCKEW